MKIDRLTRLYVGYNRREEVKIFVAANSEEEAQALVDSYGKDASIEGKFEIEALLNTTSSDINLDCGYVIVNQKEVSSIRNEEVKDNTTQVIEVFEKEIAYLLNCGMGKKKSLEHLLKMAKSMKHTTDITPVVYVSSPSKSIPHKLKKEDVWGKWSDNSRIKISDGMIVASYNDTCPIFGDVAPYKSVTVVCEEKQLDEVIYWMEYVYGADCVEKKKNLKDGKFALRANYMCW